MFSKSTITLALVAFLVLFTIFGTQSVEGKCKKTSGCGVTSNCECKIIQKLIHWKVARMPATAARAVAANAWMALALAAMVQWQWQRCRMCSSRTIKSRGMSGILLLKDARWFRIDDFLQFFGFQMQFELKSVVKYFFVEYSGWQSYLFL